MRLPRVLNNKDNKNLTLNVLASLLIRGGGIVVAFFTVPYYLRYFDNNSVLGIWFTILSVLSWILTFDLGIGNGLRNHLTREVSHNNVVACRRLISSAYVALGALVIALCAIYGVASNFVDWNNIFNIDVEVLDPRSLAMSVDISVYGVLLSFLLRIAFSILYAIQQAAIPNLINLVSHLITLLYLVLIAPSNNPNEALVMLAVVHALATNLPLVLTTIYIFTATRLKESKPSVRFADKASAKAVVSLGVTFLTIQIMYMIISTTNEWFISYYYSPQYSTEYQIYNKIFSFVGSLFMIALTPVWSAISKALAERRYEWIRKVQTLLNLVVCALVVLQLALIPLIPHLTRIWLGADALTIEPKNEIWFVLYSIIFVWIAVQSTIASGINALRSQLYCYTFAVVVKVVGVVLWADYFDSWVFVVAITSFALLPYCIIQPIEIRRRLNSLMTQPQTIGATVSNFG